MCRGERADWGSDKSSRRAEVALHYRVLLLVGDDLGDFASNVRTSIPARRDIVLRYRENWGSKWIILPNPMYGSWEAALYPTDSQLPRQARVGRKFDILTTKGVDPQ
jgi:acid phosphatase